MKKIIMILLLGLLCFLTACKGATEENQSMNSAPTMAPTATSVPKATLTPTVTPVPTATPTPEVVSTYQKGTLTETGFESEWLNLRFVAPSNIAMATQEELNVLMGMGAELMYEDQADYILAFSDMVLVYEMMAKHSSGTNISLSVELLPNSALDTTPEQYLDIMLGITRESAVDFYSDGEFHKKTILGEEYVGFYSQMSYGNATVYQETLVRKKEKRIILMVLSYQEGQRETAEYMLSLFTEYDATTPLPTAVPVSTTYQKGILTETGFESEWLDLSFRLPENMTMATQAEMDQVMIDGAGLVYGENASAYLDYTNFVTVYEMQANGLYYVPGDDAYGSQGLQIFVEKLSYPDMTEAQYIAALEQMFQTMANNNGYECIIHEPIYDVEFAGQKYAFQSIDTNYGGEVMIHQDYYLRRKEDRMICVAFTYPEGLEVSAREMWEAFAPYGEAEAANKPIALDTLQARTQRYQDVCATAYIAYIPDGGYNEFMTFARKNQILEQIPFLADIPEENTVMASGGEWYVLVPSDDTVRFTVSECVLEETSFTLVAGKELLALEAGKCVLLRGNVSDIYPSFMVTVTAADGREVMYAPGLSLMDGSLQVVDGIYDFTEYQESQFAVAYE